MSELIEKQAAIDALGEEPEVWSGLDEYAQGLNNQWHYDVNALKDLPSVQPERKTGRWIKDGVAYSLYKCTACNNICTVAGWANCIPEEQMYKMFKYCPNCGARMNEVENETKID